MRGPGPNDHHFEKNTATGGLEQKPGLGEFEPSEKARLAAAAEAEQTRLKEEALARAGAEIRNEAAALEERQRVFEAKEAELQARIDALEAREKTASGTTEGRDAALQSLAYSGARRELATDRPKT